MPYPEPLVRVRVLASLGVVGGNFLVAPPDKVPALRVERFYLAGHEIVLAAGDSLEPELDIFGGKVKVSIK